MQSVDSVFSHLYLYLVVFQGLMAGVVRLRAGVVGDFVDVAMSIDYEMFPGSCVSHRPTCHAGAGSGSGENPGYREIHPCDD
jgi:hypothetical protein